MTFETKLKTIFTNLLVETTLIQKYQVDNVKKISEDTKYSNYEITLIEDGKLSKKISITLPTYFSDKDIDIFGKTCLDVITALKKQ